MAFPQVISPLGKYGANPPRCQLCEGQHEGVQWCAVFIRMDLAERKAFLDQGKVCATCLTEGHAEADCARKEPFCVLCFSTRHWSRHCKGHFPPLVAYLKAESG
jgi:hypothetical protein